MKKRMVIVEKDKAVDKESGRSRGGGRRRWSSAAVSPGGLSVTNGTIGDGRNRRMVDEFPCFISGLAIGANMAGLGCSVYQ